MTDPDLLYRSSDVTAAAADLLEQELPSSADVATDTLPENIAAPYVLVTGRSPALSGPPMAGDQQAQHTLTVISVGENALQAKMLGDLTRYLLLGRGTDGAFLHDLVLEGRKVIARGGGTDGAPDAPGGLQQWIETYTLLLARST